MYQAELCRSSILGVSLGARHEDGGCVEANGG